MSRTATFTSEQLRDPFTLVLLIAIPVVFVVVAAQSLGEFARAIGGTLAGQAASGLAAGWSAAFVAGALGFFQVTSSRGADRRLAMAGLGPARVAGSRIAASIILAAIASAAGFLALLLRAGVHHPIHAAVGVLSFAFIYLAVGVVIGSFISGPLEGSLGVAFVFLLDVFSGPGMAPHAGPLSVSQKAADVLLTATAGASTSASDWVLLGTVVIGALAVCFAAFCFAARKRS